MRVETNSRKLIQMLEKAGWELINVTGSHHQFKHPGRPDRLTIPHPKKDLPFGLARAIHIQAGLLKR